MKAPSQGTDALGLDSMRSLACSTATDVRSIEKLAFDISEIMHRLHQRPMRILVDHDNLIVMITP